MDMINPLGLSGCVLYPKHQFTKPPANDPATPIMIVARQPSGSLPGEKNLANPPAINPKIHQTKIVNSDISTS